MWADRLRWAIGHHRLLWRPVPWLTRTRRYRRLVGAGPPQVAPIRLSAGCAPIACRFSAKTFQKELARANSPRTWKNLLRRMWRPTMVLIDLREWGDHAGWLAAVKAETDGNMGREVRKARRLGYETRPIVPGALEGSIAEIRRSKKVRAYGFVNDVVSSAVARDAENGASLVPPRPACDKHWDLGWGVFRREGGRDVLRAYAVAKRIGNVVLLMKFMGHGDVLRDGVTKLLMFDIVAWLYGGGDGLGNSVDFVWYGPLERAGPGLVEWMRDFKFKACLLDVEDVPDLDERLPPGFSARRYLALHPDVAAAGLDARTHWLLFGASEGRRYR